GSVSVGGTLDIRNRTLVLGPGFADTFFFNTLDGGTVRIDPSVKVGAIGGVLKDVVIEGSIGAVNASFFILVGEVTIRGTVKVGILTFGDSANPDLPVMIHAGDFDMSGTDNKLLLGGTGFRAGITFDPGVVFHGANVDASFTQPLLNLGTIRA